MPRPARLKGVDFKKSSGAGKKLHVRPLKLRLSGNAREFAGTGMGGATEGMTGFLKVVFLSDSGAAGAGRTA